MSSSIPKFFDIWHFADAQKSISGAINLSEMSRLSNMLKEVDSSIDFDLRFSRNRQKQATISGFVKALLKPECQRCMNAVEVSVKSEIDLIAVNSLDKYEDDSESEFYLVEDALIELSRLLEDELILSLPHISMHALGECETGYINDFDPSETGDKKDTDNPFKVLSSLKRNPL